MSLLLSASPWKNDDPGIIRKRQSSMIRQPVSPVESDSTISTANSSPPNADNQIDPSPYAKSFDETVSNNFANTQQTSEQRNIAINKLINKMTSVAVENDGNRLANFVPIDKPEITVHKPDQSSREITNEIESPENSLKLQLQQNSNQISNTRIGNYVANDTDLSQYSNYKASYDPSRAISTPAKLYGGGAMRGVADRGSLSLDPNDNKLLEKINYMIYLLEEQKNEKTANITEEFILYTFLGIFVIFIVDSFAKSGKYTR